MKVDTRPNHFFRFSALKMFLNHNVNSAFNLCDFGHTQLQLRCNDVDVHHVVDDRSERHCWSQSLRVALTAPSRPCESSTTNPLGSLLSRRVARYGLCG